MKPRRLLAWLAVPLLPAATVWILLQMQDAPWPPAAVAPVEPLPAADPPPPAVAWSVPLLRADGSPAADGVLIVAAPRAASAEVGADGVARFALRPGEAPRVLAWAPGHAPREAGPWSEPPAELRLDPLAEVPAAAAPLRLEPLSVRLCDAEGAALAGALLLVRPAGEPEAPPWLAFADADGVAACDAAAGALRLEAFAPGRAPRPPWSLGTRDHERGGAADEWRIAVARLELRDLAPMEVVRLRRDGETLDLLAAGEDGVARWEGLPPGAWEAACATGRMRLELAAGANRAAWAPERAD